VAEGQGPVHVGHGSEAVVGVGCGADGGVDAERCSSIPADCCPAYALSLGASSHSRTALWTFPDHPPAADRGTGPPRQIPPEGWLSTCPRTGPGKTAGTGCSTQPADHQPQQQPDHPSPDRRNQGPSGKRRTDRRLPHVLTGKTRSAMHSLPTNTSAVDPGWKGL